MRTSIVGIDGDRAFPAGQVLVVDTLEAVDYFEIVVGEAVIRVQGNDLAELDDGFVYISLFL